MVLLFSFRAYLYNDYVTKFFIFCIAFFSIWHIRMRVSLKRSPMFCRVIGPSSAAMIEQFLYCLQSNQALQDLLTQFFLPALQLAKQVLFLLSFMFILPPFKIIITY